MGAVHARVKYVHRADLFPPRALVFAFHGRSFREARDLFISPPTTAIARRDFSWEHSATCAVFHLRRAPPPRRGFRSSTSKFIGFFHEPSECTEEKWGGPAFKRATSALCKRIDLLADTSNLIPLRASLTVSKAFVFLNLRVLLTLWIARGPFAIHPTYWYANLQ